MSRNNHNGEGHSEIKTSNDKTNICGESNTGQKATTKKADQN